MKAIMAPLTISCVLRASLVADIAILNELSEIF